MNIAENFMHTPVKVLVHKEQLSLDEREEFKFETLLDLYASFRVSQSVIFCNTRERVERLTRLLDEEDFSALFMHSGMPQEQRDDVLHKFKVGDSRVLVSTDLLCRGIDVHQVGFVINYDLPRLNDQGIENYIHRVGRSGRFGRKGVAINFVTGRDVAMLRALEQHYNIEIREMPADIGGYLT